MDRVHKTVGVYERPEKRTGRRTALIAGSIAAAALVAAAAVILL